jgi:hypothetical protein
VSVAILSYINYLCFPTILPTHNPFAHLTPDLSRTISPRPHESEGEGTGKGKELEEGEVDEEEVGRETRPQDRGTEVSIRERRDDDKAQEDRDSNTIREAPSKTSSVVRVDPGVDMQVRGSTGDEMQEVGQGERAEGSESTEREENKKRTKEVDEKPEDKQERDEQGKRYVKHTKRRIHPRNEHRNTYRAEPMAETAVVSPDFYILFYPSFP